MNEISGGTGSNMATRIKDMAPTIAGYVHLFFGSKIVFFLLSGVQKIIVSEIGSSLPCTRLLNFSFDASRFGIIFSLI